MPALEASRFNRVDALYSDGTSFAGVRAKTTGTAQSSIDTSFSSAVQIIRDSGRGAGTFRVRRGFLKFDTSGITGTVTSATLSLTVSHGSPDLPKMAIVRGTANGSSLADFDAITGFNNSATMAGNVTDLIDGTNATNFSGVSSNTTVTITLNSTACGLITSEDDLYIVLVSYEYDYLLVEPSSNGFFDVGLYGPGTGTVSRRPHIDYTEETGYGNDVIGVDSGDISKVIGVATADINKVIGVD